MPALPNAKYERFAQLVAAGKTGTLAYIEAGHEVSRKVAGVNASRLMKNHEVKARIDELLARRQEIEERATERATERAVADLAITKERLLAELAKIAFADAGHYFDWDADGVKVRSKDELSDDQRAAVSEVSQTVTEAGGTIRVKLHNKLDAIEKLARHLGLYKIDNQQKGQAAAEALAAAEGASNRDLARAVLDVLRTAQVQDNAS